MAKYRDRIKRFDRVPQGTILKNPKNYAVHAAGQRSALRAMFEEVGIAGACIVYQSERCGGLTLIDGELRDDELAGHLVPILELDVTDDEADKLLGTMNGIGLLVDIDRKRFDDLIASLPRNNDAIAATFDLVSQRVADIVNKLRNGTELVSFESATADDQQRLDQKDPIKCPHCGAEFVVE